MKKTILYCSLLFLVWSCKKTTNPLDTFDRSTLLKNLADSVVVPAYSHYYQQTNALSIAAVQFSTSPTSTNLVDLKTAWAEANIAWMQVEMYHFFAANDLNANAQLASWPANFSAIETEINGTATINEPFIASTGSTRKGLSAIEYLLYGSDGVIDSFTLSATKERRKAYLTALCAHQVSLSSALQNEWKGGSSYTQFTTQTQLDISGAMNLMVNSLAEHIEFVRRDKVGKPSGNEGSNIDGTKCENYLSQTSLLNIQANILAWKTILTSNNTVGLDDYLDHVDAKYDNQLLSTVILEHIEVCLQKADAISVPLHQAVVSQPQQVSELFLALKKLTVLTKVDLASNLGVIITFSDNDGD